MVNINNFKEQLINFIIGTRSVTFINIQANLESSKKQNIKKLDKADAQNIYLVTSSR